MPLPYRTLTDADIARVCADVFTPSPQQSVGIELEWPLHRLGDVSSRPGEADMTPFKHEVLPAGGRVTFEPGGQVEISSAPAASVSEALRAVEGDSRTLGKRLLHAGFARETLAVDTRRPPARTLRHPRYHAMEQFFAKQGGAGTWMMCNTASVQVNISLDHHDAVGQWHAMHRIAPILIAAFANSPGVDAAGRRWCSMRQAIWWHIDPPRTRPVPDDRSPEQAWARYALDADVMYIDAGAAGVALLPGLTFGRWMTAGHHAGWPTEDDLRYHMSTLFPPVRPRGWLELRVLDALPAPIRDVAILAVATACTREAAADLRKELPETRGLWRTAAAAGLKHPVLAQGARTLFEVVADCIDCVSTDAWHAEIVTEFAEQYVWRGRSPADTQVPRLVPNSAQSVPAMQAN